MFEVCLGAILWSILPLVLQAASFVNFESAPVHPLDLSPDGKILAVCNLADGRLELLDVTADVPVSIGSVPLGVDPVTVRFRTTNEIWAVNHISGSISIVDLARRRVIDTLTTRSGPADVVFAGFPQRAYVACANEDLVQVFNPISHGLEAELQMDGDRPKAMAVSPDGGKVYVAIFESGNASTILAGAALRHPAGPYGGQFPVPNHGLELRPPLFINPAVPGPVYSEVPDSLIVKRNNAGRWMDDNHGDWTEFVSGTNSTLPEKDGVWGRPAGWDIRDHDLAIINTTNHQVGYVTGLMNICMALGVNPVSGKVAVVGTEATNERRFIPNLRGTFIQVQIALIDPASGTRTIRDLNPHLDYAQPTVPLPLRNRSIGDPRGVVWNASGDRGYVAGMGSRNLVVIDADGNRINEQPTEVGEGPVGLVLDEQRNRLYVLNRFSAEVALVNLTSLQTVTNIPLFDPTPAVVRLGRKHFYDTRETSGLGQLSCASCHVDGRIDRLAWDLGNPADSGISPSGEYFHPMKGPLMTQTLQDIIGHEPLHWRGDRAGIEEFNETFTDLMAADQLLSTAQMEEFKSFLATIFFPPNRYRNFDNSLRTNIPLPGIFGVDPISGRPDLTPLVSGDARRGRDVFTIVCAACHREESGRGIGLDNEPVRRENGRIFKVAQLRNISDKLGMSTLTNSSRSGFGLRFDGRDDSFTRFLADVFGMKTRDEIADLNAFMLSFTGADILHNPTPGSFSRDTVAAVGRQVTVTNQADQAFLIKSMVALARSPTGRVDLVARGEKDGLSRGWAFDRTSGYFQSDRNNEDLSADNLMTLAGPTRELTLTMVPEGTGIRLGIDRDEDGYYDRTESDLGFNPIDSSSHGANHAPQIADLPTMTVHPGTPIAVTLQVTDADASQTVALSMDPGAPSGATFSPATGHFSWAVPTNSTVDSVEVVFRALDNGSPPLSDARALTIRVNRMRMTHRLSLGRLLLTWESIPGKTYRVQSTVMPGTTWEDLPAGPIVATAARTTLTIPAPITSGQRFYRVRWVQ